MDTFCITLLCLVPGLCGLNLSLIAPQKLQVLEASEYTGGVFLHRMKGF